MGTYFPSWLQIEIWFEDQDTDEDVWVKQEQWNKRPKLLARGLVMEETFIFSF